MNSGVIPKFDPRVGKDLLVVMERSVVCLRYRARRHKAMKQDQRETKACCEPYLAPNCIYPECAAQVER